MKTKREEMSERGDGGQYKEEMGGEVVKMKSNKLPLLQCQSHGHEKGHEEKEGRREKQREGERREKKGKRKNEL